MRSAWRISLHCLVPLLLLACLDDKHPCDDGQVFADGVCSPRDTEPAAEAGAGGMPPVEAGAGGAGEANDLGEFGRECDDDVTHADCAEPAPYCAIQPGMDVGTCTTTGCVEHPEVCPDGWGCLDLGAFSAGLPAICTES